MSHTTDMRGHFELRATPFTRELPVEQRFDLPLFTDVIDALLTAVEGRQSAALLAPAGTGKTALLRALVARLPPARYRTHYVKVTSLSKRDMCREIATAVGAEPAGSYPALVRRLQECFSLASAQDGLRPVLVIDEAHDLRPDVLSIVGLLTNFDYDSRLVVSILLCGQPPLRTLLRRDDNEAIARRLVHVATLRPLVREESARYVAHRCRIAGATRELFAPGALDAIFEIGRGNLRATNRLGLKSLEVAHRRNTDVVDGTHVTEARAMLWA